MEKAEEQWEQGVVYKDVPPFETGSAWDDDAIIKAFDEALSLHRTRRQDARTEKVVVPKEVGIKNTKPKAASRNVRFDVRNAKHDVRNDGEQDVEEDSSDAEDLDQTAEDYTEVDMRFEALLRKNQKEAAAAAAPKQRPQQPRGAGIPGDWEPVLPKTPAAQQEQPASSELPGGSGTTADAQWAAWAAYYNQVYQQQQQQQPQTYAHYPQQYPHGYPYSHQYYPQYQQPGPAAPPPTAFAAAFAQGPPPPPMQMPPTTGYDTELDEALADVLLSWYYSGYYTGRLRAVLDRRS